MQANANVTFNTHKAVKALKTSGFDENQAEAVVEVIDKAVHETVATKSDIVPLRADLDTLGKTVGDIQDDIKENMATKAELNALGETVKGIQDNIKENMATKAELRALGETVKGIQDDIKENMATKTDLELLGKTVKTDIANLETRMMRMMYFQAMILVGMFVTVVVKLL